MAAAGSGPAMSPSSVEAAVSCSCSPTCVAQQGGIVPTAVETKVARQDTQELFDNLPGPDTDLEKSANSAVQPATLTFKDLSFSIGLPNREQKLILAPCSGHFEPGQLVALMGPSGCGKTTLLDMLAMKKTAKYDGEVFVNGHPRDPANFQRIAAYVGQEDVMPSHWTVKEAIDFNVRLKQHHVSSTRRTELVDSLLQCFGLDGVANTYIGGAHVRGISGGQRRRVSLVRGVAAQASMLFCDEPTSGLSATDAELCMKAMRIIAKRLGVLVVVVIHQPRPEVARLFDTLLLMTSNPGRMVYSGPMDQAIAYFEECGYPAPVHANPADFLLDLATPVAEGDCSQDLASAYCARQMEGNRMRAARGIKAKGQTVDEMLTAAHEQLAAKAGIRAAARPQLGPHAAPFLVQFLTLMRRKLRITFRNPAAVGLQIGLPIVMGLLLGSVFQGVGSNIEDMSALFFLAHVVPFLFILLTMLGLQSLPIMPLLIEDRSFMKHEASEALYAESVAVLVTFCIDVPMSLIAAASQAFIIYVFSGLSWEFFGEVAFWTILVFLFFDAIFSLVAAIAVDAQQAQTLAIPFVSVFMIFNGFIVTKDSAPMWLKGIFELSPTAYGLQAIVSRVTDSLKDKQLVLDQFHFTPVENTKGMLVILSSMVLLRLLQTVALRTCNNIRK
mmetsp:Transcript_21196/g.48412  ORF Transcript_21196/g.48412 Transcript_21196/m.48412 type:complete len:670 (+) Transcript_21196:51-2060(+)